jgi:cell division protein FtsA
VLEKVNLQATHHTVAGLAAAEAVLNRRQREAGTLVLDIGASTTNLAVIEDGEVQHVAVIPMGGTNITNDLAIGLKVDLEIAEDVKLKHAAVGPSSKTGKVSVQHENRNHVFAGDEVSMIVEARIEEIFEYVDKELRSIHKARKLPGGVVIVGGTANIAGIAAMAKDKLEVAARVGKAGTMSGIVEDIQDPSYITAIGLMQLDMLFAEAAFTGGQPANASNGIFSGLGSLWQKFKG